MHYQCVEKGKNGQRNPGRNVFPPLVDYVNAVIGDISEHKLTDTDINELEKMVEKSTNDQMRSIAEEMLKEAAEKRTQISKRAHELHKSEAWLACFAATMCDKQLRVLITKFEIALGNFLFERTDKNHEELMNLGEQILARADEVVIKGSKMPRVERLKKRIKNEPHLL